MSWVQRLFVTMDDFKSCLLAQIVSTVVQAAVIIGTVVAIVATIPEYQYVE